MRKALVAGIVSFGLLAGCLNSRADQLNAWTNQPEEELFLARGAPDRTVESGGAKFLSYDSQNGYGAVMHTDTFQVDKSTGLISRASCSSSTMGC